MWNLKKWYADLGKVGMDEGLNFPDFKLMRKHARDTLRFSGYKDVTRWVVTDPQGVVYNVKAFK